MEVRAGYRSGGFAYFVHEGAEPTMEDQDRIDVNDVLQWCTTLKVVYIFLDLFSSGE